MIRPARLWCRALRIPRAALAVTTADEGSFTSAPSSSREPRGGFRYRERTSRRDRMRDSAVRARMEGRLSRLSRGVSAEATYFAPRRALDDRRACARRPCQVLRNPDAGRNECRSLGPVECSLSVFNVPDPLRVPTDVEIAFLFEYRCRERELRAAARAPEFLDTPNGYRPAYTVRYFSSVRRRRVG